MHFENLLSRKDSQYLGNKKRVSLNSHTLQHTATYCIMLQRTATRYSTMHHAAPWKDCCLWALGQHTATHCNTLQYTATHCNTTHLGKIVACGQWFNTLQHTKSHTTTHCYTLAHTASHCNTLDYTATCNTLQHASTPCNTLQHPASRNDLCL